VAARNKLWGMLAMGEFKHFVIVKFKEGVAVDELTKGMEKLVSEIDAVKAFEWYMFSVLLPCTSSTIFCVSKVIV